MHVDSLANCCVPNSINLNATTHLASMSGRPSVWMSDELIKNASFAKAIRRRHRGLNLVPVVRGQGSNLKLCASFGIFIIFAHETWLLTEYVIAPTRLPISISRVSFCFVSLRRKILILNWFFSNWPSATTHCLSTFRPWLTLIRGFVLVRFWEWVFRGGAAKSACYKFCVNIC